MLMSVQIFAYVENSTYLCKRKTETTTFPITKHDVSEFVPRLVTLTFDSMGK